ncbi:gamma-tubulin complex component 4 [Aspergillus udagawae]|nr:gamma-tubulin complex component 4 [Aspergillus udagawae]
MLHEVLLSLSGQPSPLFAFSSEEDVVSEDAFPLSPPEKALLTSLARLSRLHARLREHTALISSSHPSIICRAVSSAINAHHLGGFQRKILEVEKAILAEDSAYVGGYGIVPLSTIVGEFSPWTRRLEWLWEVARFVLPQNRTSSAHSCTGSALIDYLRTESQTGYLDLEEIALHLITVAESAWMRQLSTWLLYGNLPVFGKDDFFIQEDNTSQMDDSSSIASFVMQTSLLPKFVSLHTASSILFIGKTLNHITAKRKGATAGSSGSAAPPVTLQGEHIAHLASLESPISPSKLSNAVDSIRLSLSQSVLSKLLPLPKILEILSVLHDFLLLGRGEFATALVSHAEARLIERHRRPELLAGRVRAQTELEGLVVKDGDIIHALAHTWAELYSLQNEEDPVDESLDLARDLVRLSIKSGHTVAPLSDEIGSDLVAEISDVSFEDLLFPTRTSISVEVQIGSFFQGEVVNGCWQHFREWIQGGLATVSSSISSRPGTSASLKSRYSDSPIEGRGDIERSSQAAPQRLDPETLTVAHRRYLFSLVQSLFLTDKPFTVALRSLLSLIDHFIALIIRLESVQKNMDLETDEGVVDALADYPREETELLEALRAARMEVEGGIRDVVARLRDIDDSRSGEGRKLFDLVKHARATPLADRQNGSGVNAQFCQYLPRVTAGVDQLLMKLDFGHANGSLGPTAPVAGDSLEME